MALVFSPVTQDVMEGPFQPRPRHAFLMLHSAERRSRLDRELESSTASVLQESGVTAIRATDIGGTGDYLEKIIGLIRGCGLGVAVFTEATPPPTLANIFFEVGLCPMFGRPVVLAKTAEAITPSDFVRTEWVARYENEGQFRANLLATLDTLLTESVRYYRSIAEVAIEADEVDYEIAFERFVQAYLLGGEKEDLDDIRRIYDALRSPSEDPRLHTVRRRLRATVGHFVKLATG
ncbi:hypothetical protein [Rubrivirga sp.]|uniref:hypothetical protein n=1 Tax=Rubrivirga sp. TaxID=1885344 RepID=UPI003B51F488